MNPNDGEFVAVGDSFRKGELWQSPRGKLWRVESVVSKTATLVSHKRRVTRQWDAVIGWVINERARENGA